MRWSNEQKVEKRFRWMGAEGQIERRMNIDGKEKDRRVKWATGALL